MLIMCKPNRCTWCPVFVVKARQGYQHSMGAWNVCSVVTVYATFFHVYFCCMCFFIRLCITRCSHPTTRMLMTSTGMISWTNTLQKTVWMRWEPSIHVSVFSDSHWTLQALFVFTYFLAVGLSSTVLEVYQRSSSYLYITTEWSRLSWAAGISPRACMLPRS